MGELASNSQDSDLGATGFELGRLNDCECVRNRLYGIKYTENIKQIRHTTSEPLPCGPATYFKTPHRKNTGFPALFPSFSLLPFFPSVNCRFPFLSFTFVFSSLSSCSLLPFCCLHCISFLIRFFPPLFRSERSLLLLSTVHPLVSFFFLFNSLLPFVCFLGSFRVSCCISFFVLYFLHVSSLLPLWNPLMSWFPFLLYF